MSLQETWLIKEELRSIRDDLRIVRDPAIRRQLGRRRKELKNALRESK